MALRQYDNLKYENANQQSQSYIINPNTENQENENYAFTEQNKTEASHNVKLDKEVVKSTLYNSAFISYFLTYVQENMNSDMFDKEEKNKYNTIIKIIDDTIHKHSHAIFNAIRIISKTSQKDIISKNEKEIYIKAIKKTIKQKISDFILLLNYDDDDDLNTLHLKSSSEEFLDIIKFMLPKKNNIYKIIKSNIVDDIINIVNDRMESIINLIKENIDKYVENNKIYIDAFDIKETNNSDQDRMKEKIDQIANMIIEERKHETNSSINIEEEIKKINIDNEETKQQNTQLQDIQSKNNFKILECDNCIYDMHNIVLLTNTN